MSTARNEVDPTRTKTRRAEFGAHLRQRFNAIKWHVRRAIEQRDVFGLSPGSGIGLSALAAEFARNNGLDPVEFVNNVDTDDDITPPYREWADLRDAQATAEFDEWLDGAMQREVLEKYEGETYVRAGYMKGVENADSGLKEAGLAAPDRESIAPVIRRPVHRDQLERIYTRAYQGLDGITDATANQMRRELADGLGAGENPRDIARSLNDRVEKVGKTRATVLARTEVIRAHSEATLTRFEEVAGDVPVTVKAEWLTAKDNRVCPECEALEGREFSIDEARGMLPLHPQCRCSWRPVQKT